MHFLAMWLVHWIVAVIILQVFSLTRLVWTRHVTKCVQAETGEYVIFPNFQIPRVAKNGRSIWLWKYAQIFFFGHYVSLEGHSLIACRNRWCPRTNVCSHAFHRFHSTQSEPSLTNVTAFSYHHFALTKSIGNLIKQLFHSPPWVHHD